MNPDRANIQIKQPQNAASNAAAAMSKDGSGDGGIGISSSILDYQGMRHLQ